MPAAIDRCVLGLSSATRVKKPAPETSDLGVPPIPANDAASAPPIGTSVDVARHDEAIHDAYSALRSTNYRRFVTGFLVSSTGLQMLGAGISWEIYARTKDPLALGWIGVARALPVILFALPAGQVVDHFDRRKVLVLTQVAMGAAAALLSLASALPAIPLWTLYAALSLMGCARVFNGPSRATLLPLIVERDVFPNAVTWNSGAFHFAATAGPILAGVMLAAFDAAWPIYAITAGACWSFAMSASLLKPRESNRAKGPISLRTMVAGAHHVYQEKTILAAITLDLFAVLLGGATALLPIYAKDILVVAPSDYAWLPAIVRTWIAQEEIRYGILRAAPFVGAVLMTLVVAHRPLTKNAGPMLLGAVAGFGLCIIVFGLSTSFFLSLAALFLSGAIDNISVIIRHVLVQVRTPDALRGRVSAVNSVFIESSNELGGFESGLVAKIFGPIVSVVSGGIGTVLVVAAVALAWPQIRRLGELREKDQ